MSIKRLLYLGIIPTQTLGDTQTTVPDPPTIDSVNSGDTEIFVNFTLGADGGAPVSDVQFQLNGGNWESGMTTASPLVITGQPNQSEFTEIRIRAVNAVGVSNSSNMVEGRSTKRLQLMRYFALDTDMHSQLSDITFEIGELSGHDVVHSANRTDDTPDESWERLSGQQAGYSGGFGSILEDHNGDLRLYYWMRFPNTGGELTSYALMISTNDGATWPKERVNANTGLISDSQSNLIFIPKPSGVDANEIESASFYYDPNGSAGQEYKVVYTWKGSSNIFYATSSDGITFSGGNTLFVTENAGDISVNGLFWDGDDWIVAGRGRGRGGSLEEPYPKPYEDTRWTWIAKSSTTFDGTYDIDYFVIDPATLFGYGSEADQESFWDLISDGCGSRYVPDNPGEAEVRPDLYHNTVTFYEDQYIGLFPVFFRDDDKVTYSDNDRTAGEIIPVWFHALDVLSEGGTEGWEVPSEDSGVDVTPYLRTNNDSCSVFDGESRVGQLYSGFGFVRKSEHIISAVVDVSTTHYDGVNFDFDRVIELSVEMLTEDRFAGLIADGGGGTWRTARIHIPYGTTELLVNTDANTKVEILNSITGDPIPGFTEADAVEITTSGVAREATWASNSINELEGQNVRLKFYYDSGSVYAFRFN